MNIMRVDSEQWALLSKDAHLVVFNEDKDPRKERISFALIGGEEDPCFYLTVREVMSDYAYLPYGGLFKPSRGNGSAHDFFKMSMKHLSGLGYNKVSFLVENTNKAMLIVALKYGMEIIGVRHFKGDTLVEFFKEGV